MSTIIAFIGTGVMGRSMAGHLQNAGYALRVFNRTREKATALIDAGAEWCDSPGDTAAGADVVITMVGFPEDVEEVYFGADGVLARARSGTLLIDMTTSSPLLAKRIESVADAQGCMALDAPVSGGDVGAREARLSIMVGGQAQAFERARPILEVMGTNVVHQGSAGAGQHAKLANQIAIAAGMLGVCEALAYARKAGLDADTVLASITNGAAGSWSLSNLGPRMIAGDFEPGFLVKHFIKDMKIAVDSAGDIGLDAPGLTKALERYEELAATPGGGDLGTHGLFKLYDD